MELLGIRLVGINSENGQKLLLTIGLIVIVLFAKKLISVLLALVFKSRENKAIRFWSRQGLNLMSAAFIVISFLSIWFDNPARLATGIGLVTAGLAFALQKVVTSFAGYLMIMRGNTFSVGERITMGGIRGDVIELNFLQTTIMEMGQPASVQAAEPAMWVRGRQFTGRLVTVTNDKVFEDPVYNYTRDFPYIWEEILVPVKYSVDKSLAESIMIDSVVKETSYVDMISEPERKRLDEKYGIKTDDINPKVFYRLTDNWLELSIRFIVPEHGVRDIKSDISRRILEGFNKNQIEVASATYEIVGLPKIELYSSSKQVRRLPVDNFEKPSPS